MIYKYYEIGNTLDNDGLYAEADIWDNFIKTAKYIEPDPEFTQPYEAYAVLGLPYGVDMNKVKQYIRQLSLTQHPDVATGEKISEDIFRIKLGAYTFLKNTKQIPVLTPKQEREYQQIKQVYNKPTNEKQSIPEQQLQDQNIDDFHNKLNEQTMKNREEQERKRQEIKKQKDNSWIGKFRQTVGM